MAFTKYIAICFAAVVSAGSSKQDDFYALVKQTGQLTEQLKSLKSNKAGKATASFASLQGATAKSDTERKAQAKKVEQARAQREMHNAEIRAADMKISAQEKALNQAKADKQAAIGQLRKIQKKHEELQARIAKLEHEKSAAEVQRQVAQNKGEFFMKRSREQAKKARKAQQQLNGVVALACVFALLFVLASGLLVFVAVRFSYYVRKVQKSEETEVADDEDAAEPLIAEPVVCHYP